MTDTTLLSSVLLLVFSLSLSSIFICYFSFFFLLQKRAVSSANLMGYRLISAHKCLS